MRGFLLCHCSLKINWSNCIPMLMLCFSQRQAHETSCVRHWADSSHWHYGNTHTNTRMHVQSRQQRKIVQKTASLQQYWLWRLGELELIAFAPSPFLVIDSGMNMSKVRASSVLRANHRHRSFQHNHIFLNKRAICPLACPLICSLSTYKPSC